MKHADNLKLQHAHKQQEVILFGLPLKIFALAALCGGFLLLLALVHLGWLLGLLIGGLCCVAIFSPLRWAHKHDLRAWELWLHAYFGKFTKETLLKKRMFIMTQRGVMPYQQWKHQHDKRSKKN